MNDPRREMQRLMQRVKRRQHLPGSERIVAETFQRLGYLPGAMPASEVLQNFNGLLFHVFTETLVTLELYEEQTFAAGIPQEFFNAYPTDMQAAEQTAQREGFSAGVAQLFSGWYPRLRRAFQSIGQGRMARGGKDFELEIEGLFKLAHLPYEKQEIQEHTDFILPSAAFHNNNRTASAVVSVKRTLRERGAEVVEELMSLRAANVFLLTADEKVTQMHIDTICRQYNIHMVVWDRLKAAKFPNEPLVLGYSDWANTRLPMLRQFWPEIGQ